MTPSDYTIDSVRAARGAVLLPPPLGDLAAGEVWRPMAFLRGHPDAPRPPGVLPLVHEDDDTGLTSASPPDDRGAAAVAYLASDNVLALGGRGVPAPTFLDLILLAGTNGADARVRVGLYSFFEHDDALLAVGAPPGTRLDAWAPVDCGGGITLIAGRRERVDLRRALHRVEPGALAVVPMRIDNRAPRVVVEVAFGCGL